MEVWGAWDPWVSWGQANVHALSNPLMVTRQLASGLLAPCPTGEGDGAIKGLQESVARSAEGLNNCTCSPGWQSENELEILFKLCWVLPYPLVNPGKP